MLQSFEVAVGDHTVIAPEGLGKSDMLFTGQPYNGALVARRAHKSSGAKASF